MTADAAATTISPTVTFLSADTTLAHRRCV